MALCPRSLEVVIVILKSYIIPASFQEHHVHAGIIGPQRFRMQCNSPMRLGMSGGCLLEP